MTDLVETIRQAQSRDKLVSSLRFNIEQLQGSGIIERHQVKQEDFESLANECLSGRFTRENHQTESHSLPTSQVSSEGQYVREQSATGIQSTTVPSYETHNRIPDVSCETKSMVTRPAELEQHGLPLTSRSQSSEDASRPPLVICPSNGPAYTQPGGAYYTNAALPTTQYGNHRNMHAPLHYPSHPPGSMLKSYRPPTEYSQGVTMSSFGNAEWVHKGAEPTRNQFRYLYYPSMPFVGESLPEQTWWQYSY